MFVNLLSKLRARRKGISCPSWRLIRDSRGSELQLRHSGRLENRALAPEAWDREFRGRANGAGHRRSQVLATSIALALLIGFALARPAHAENIKSLKPQGYVNDFAGVISPSAKEKLTALCQEVDQKAAVQIAIVTVRSLDGAEAADYAVNLAQQWGVGPKQKDRGIMILLAPNDRKYFVAVGYGLEPILPDGKVGGFGREMVPLLKQNDYSGALLLLTQRIANVVAQDRGVTLTQQAGQLTSRPRPAPPQIDLPPFNDPASACLHRFPAPRISI